MRAVPALVAFAVGASVASGPVIARAQPVDPYGDAAPAPSTDAPKAKAPKNPKVPKRPKAPKPAQPDAGPVDPYADAQPAAPAPQPAGGPVDPYAEPAPAPPAPQPTPPAPPPAAAKPDEPQASDVDEAVAAALVARARHLLDVSAWADAKQLAVESLVRSPNGASAPDAKDIVRIANQHLGIVEPEAPPPTPKPVVDTATPAEPPPAVTARGEEGAIRGAHVLGGYGFAGGALLGLGVVGAGDGVSGAGADTAGAVVGGLAVGGLAYWLGDRNDISVADARTIGAGATWGAIDFALLTDVVGGANVHTSHDEVAVGASIGLALGTLGGVAYAHEHALSANDVTVIDSFGGMGVVGGLAIGELMQPFASEAYSMNAAIGAAGGVALGLYLAPDHEISSGRMLRVDGLAAVGAGAPWLLYALVQDPTTDNDERVFGLLSAAGLLTGAYLGFKWTEGYDEKHLSEKPKRVEVGALGFRPASTPLATDVHARGMVLDVLRGTW